MGNSSNVARFRIEILTYTNTCYCQYIFPSYRDRREDHFAILLDQCRKGISWRYGESSPAVEKRFSEELDLLQSKGYMDYFLVVADIVRRRPIHCGRGSAAASLVSYLLGITHVDPIRHNLLFGRFLNPHRKDHPDIDVDFPWDERDDLMEEVRRFEHLVIYSSIIRPAANRYIKEYVGRLHGEPYEPLHPRLKDLLAETYGILVYQEDVVRVTMALAGFGWAEADGLRKVLSKKSAEQLSHYRRRFHEGCGARGVFAQVEETVWDMFTSLAGYSFCKPHSASYALVSFKSAYLKAHHPAEFMAAVISNGGGYYSTLAYVSEARRMGISVLGPDINESDSHWLGKGKTVRLGLQQLQDIRRETLEAALAERGRNGPFVSLEDFLRRVPLTSSDGSVLVKSGCLDSLAGAANGGMGGAADGRRGRAADGRDREKPEASAPERKAVAASSPRSLNRPQLLWLVESWLNANAHSNRKGKQDRAAPGLHLPRTIRVPSLPDLSPAQKWRQEMDSLGFVLSVHPLTLFEPAIRSFAQRMRIIPASELGRRVGRRVWVAGWPITRKEVLTREGEPMELVSFEDETAIYETVFFPEAFRRFCQEVDMGRAYLLCGQVGSEFGAVSLTVHQLRKCRPDRDPPPPAPSPAHAHFPIRGQFTKRKK